MSSLTQKATILSVGLVLGVSLTIGHTVFADRDNIKAPLPLTELKTFSEVFEKIKTDYVEPVGDSTLLENAIRGMLSGLDPHSNYLDPEAFQELQVGTTGEFGGLGIEVGMEDGFVKVISPIDDTPAQRAGVLSGDLIVRIDDTPVKGLSLSEAVELMPGKPENHPPEFGPGLHVEPGEERAAHGVSPVCGRAFLRRRISQATPKRS